MMLRDMFRGALFFPMLALGCRQDVSSPGNGNPPPVGAAFDQTISFGVTGLNASTRNFTNVVASYSAALNETLLQTQDDSTTAGKFIMRWRGGGIGDAAYHVNGSVTDTNDMYIRFISGYQGTKPTAVFELTGLPQDSLEGHVSVSYYGALHDSIVGTFTARLKMIDSSTVFDILIYSGKFRVEHTK